MSDVSFDQMAAQQLQAEMPPEVMPAEPTVPTPEPEPVAAPVGMPADVAVVPVVDGEMRWGNVVKTLQNNRRPNFGPNFSFSYRPVVGMGGNLSPAQQARVKEFVRRSQMQDGTPVEYYTGEFLVNADGVIARPPYNPKKDTYDILYSLRPAQRHAVQQMLVASGRYGGARPYNKNITAEDQNVFSELLMSANTIGTTWDVALARVISGGGTFSGYGNNKFRSEVPSETAPQQAPAQPQMPVEAPPVEMGQPVDEQASRLVQVVDIFNEMLAER